VRVEPDHNAYDDPEWVADAAAGALRSEHGLRCVYHDYESLSHDPYDLLDGA